MSFFMTFFKASANVKICPKSLFYKYFKLCSRQTDDVLINNCTDCTFFRALDGKFKQPLMVMQKKSVPYLSLRT